MLSYLVPVDEKPLPIPSEGTLSLELLGSQGSPEVPPRKSKTYISKESSTSSFTSDLTISSSTPTGGVHDRARHKLLINGTKHPPLKRVSFGSSKGSMVETLIYESPLQEVPESSPPALSVVRDTQNLIVHDDVAFHVPAEHEAERSKVRVSFYQGARPQCVSPPAHEPAQPASCPARALDMADHVVYNRQISTESGWDNPFRPDGDLSREADEIVSLIKGGKPITPTPHGTPLGPDEQDAVALNVSANESSPQSKVATSASGGGGGKAMNGTGKNGTAPAEARPGPVDVLRQPPAEPLQPEHVTIKKKPKCKCCVIQ